MSEPTNPMIAAAVLMAQSSLGLASVFGRLREKIELQYTYARRSERKRHRRATIRASRAANVRRMQRERS